MKGGGWCVHGVSVESWLMRVEFGLWHSTVYHTVPPRPIPSSSSSPETIHHLVTFLVTNTSIAKIEAGDRRSAARSAVGYICGERGNELGTRDASLEGSQAARHIGPRASKLSDDIPDEGEEGLNSRLDLGCPRN